MALVSSSLWQSKNQHKKRTRQGNGRGTKFGAKPTGKAGKKSRNRYKKKSRGQGK